jgi:glycosyltransferase involved in cell wall biosynthesis
MPVIAWNHGACKETIKHGETGFLVNSQEEMEKLIKDDAVSTIKSSNCIEWANQFSYDNMIKRYEDLCFESIDTGGW